MITAFILILVQHEGHYHQGETLLRELERTKPPSQSLSAYVRSLLRQAVVRRNMAEAADR